MIQACNKGTSVREAWTPCVRTSRWTDKISRRWPIHLSLLILLKSVRSYSYLLRNPKSNCKHIDGHGEGGRISSSRPYDTKKRQKLDLHFQLLNFLLLLKSHPSEVMGSGKGRTSRRWSRSALFWVTALFLLVSLFDLID